ncbi:MAG: elongation factor Ts, partial [Pseudonocardiales bacterium]|nr:elongation factor Ts [Pseudonocardiales bacterium]
KGEAKAAKRGAERTAANGLVAAAAATDGAAMIELASETDFVAKNEQFQDLAARIVARLADSSATDVESLAAEQLDDGRTVAESVEALAAVIGEKLELRRAARLSGQVATYLHRKAKDLPPQVGVLVSYAGDDLDAARGAAMQVAAMRPQYLTRDQVPAEVLETEKRVAEAKAREEGKPEAALPKIVEGRVNSFFKDVVLLEQAAVQDSKKTVKSLLDDAGVTIAGFAHFEVGRP